MNRIQKVLCLFLFILSICMGERLPSVSAFSITLVLFPPEYGSCGDVSINGVVIPDTGTITRLSWDWDDGSVVDSWFPAAHHYSSNGSYSVLVTAYASTGETQTASTNVTIVNAEDPLCNYTVRLHPQPVVLRGGKTTEKLRLEVRDLNGVQVPPPGTVSFASTNPALAQVDSAGNVNSTGFGEAEIEATIAGLPRTAKTRVIAGHFRVEPPILLLDTSSQLTGQLTLNVASADGTPLNLSGHTVTFGGGNSVASVNNSGLVRALRPPQSFAETPYIEANIDGTQSHNAAVIRVTSASLGLSMIQLDQPYTCFHIASQVGSYNYQQIFSDSDASRITNIAYQLELEACGLRPLKGDTQYLVNDLYHGNDGTGSGPCGLSGNPIRLGTNVDQSIHNSCLIVAFPPATPQWGVFFHEMGHNFTLASTRFAQFVTGSNVGNSNFTYIEGLATAVDLYAAQMMSQRASQYQIPPDTMNAILTSVWHFGSTPDLDNYINGGANYSNINPSVLDDMITVLADQYGYRLLQRFYSVFLPPEVPFSFDINSDAKQATFFVAAMSAAAGTDLRTTFLGQWGFPVDDTYYNSIYPQVKRLLAQPAIFPASRSFPSSGGSGTVDVYASSGYNWTAASNDPWITITSSSSGSGNGTVDFSVAENTNGNLRTGTLTIGQQTFTVDQEGSPTAVTLVSLTATQYDNGVFVQWQTGLEVKNLGFHVYRNQAGQRVRITPEIVAGSALIAGNETTLTAGNAYAWWDALSKDKQDAQYWLEDLDIDGKSTLHGPITPKRIAGLPAEQGTAALLSRIGKGEPRISQPASNQTASAGPSQKQFETQLDLAGKPAVKLTIKEEGWYRVTQPELLAAGLDPKADPRNLQLYVEGQKQAMFVAGEQDGVLDQSDAIEFYAYGQDKPSTDAHTYWLVSSKQPGKRIIVTRSEAKPGGAMSFSYTVERRERAIYFSSLKNGDTENFFGRVITSQPADLELKLQHLDSASQADGVLEVALQGVTDFPGPGTDHLVKVTLNGTPVGRMIFDGRQHPVESFSVPHSLLKEGQNVVSLAAEAGPSDISLVDFIRITYRHSYTADQDTLRMTVGGMAPLASQAQTIDGFTNSSIRVMDVTNSGEPRELKGQIEERKGGGFAVTVQADGGGARALIALTSDRIKRPASITANKPSNWRGKNHSADLVIITHSTFAGSLSPLVALRERKGFAVESVDIEDIYDEFSFGEKSPGAIKDFLAFTRVNWNLAPRFVLFAGDTSFDPRNYLGAGDFDLVPTKLIDTTYLETASDDWFADFNDDGIAEMYIGRLPVRTISQAAAVVAKIVSYGLSLGRPAIATSVLLVADRNDGFNFEQASDQLRSLIPADATVQQIFRGRLDDVTAKRQLIASINSGPWIVNYTGHGSTNTWRSLLATSDIQSLQNKTLPVFITMTCLNGFIQDPVTESLSKALINAERGGAVAVWTSSGMTVPGEQALINQQLYRMLFARWGIGGQGLTIGEAAATAKAATKDLDVRRTWLLLGDPTMRLR